MKKVLFIVVLAFVASLVSNAQSFSSKNEDCFFKAKKSPLACGFTQDLKMDDSFSFVPNDENDANKKRRKKKHRGSSSASLSLEAQTGIFIPTGTFSDGSGIGFGGLTNFFFPVSEQLHLGIGTGFYTFSGKTYTIMDGASGMLSEFTGPSIGMLPILVHGRYFFNTESFAPYAGVSTGLYLYSGDATGTNFGLTPKFGFLLGEDMFKFNAEAGYGLIFTEGYTTSFIEIKVGLNISF